MTGFSRILKSAESTTNYLPMWVLTYPPIPIYSDIWVFFFLFIDIIHQLKRGRVTYPEVVLDIVQGRHIGASGTVPPPPSSPLLPPPPPPPFPSPAMIIIIYIDCTRGYIHIIVDFF